MEHDDPEKDEWDVRFELLHDTVLYVKRLDDGSLQLTTNNKQLKVSYLTDSEDTIDISTNALTISPFSSR